VAISQPLLPNLVHQERLTNLSILGALTGLMMIYGLAPAPFGPGLLQFLLHDCDLRALTPAFISEWYPELHHTLQNWKALDPSSNDLAPFCSHFATYHDTEVISISLVTFYIVLEYY